MIQSRKTCWIVTNSNAGVLSQALGLAENMGLNAKIKHVQRRFPFSLIPPLMKTLGRWSINFTTKNSNTLTAPWPDVVIASGAQSVHFCLYIRKKSKGKSFCIYLQDPKISSDNFDLVIKMEHDSIKGKNVLQSKLALNRITQEKLKKEEKEHNTLFKQFAKPFVSILIGGSTKRYTMNKTACEDLLHQIKNAIKQRPEATFLITPSRRTPTHLLELLHSNFTQNKKIYIVDPQSKSNPYLAMLSIAEEIFVTNDSVNMVSEACSAGKPVYIIKLQGLNQGKPVAFSNNLIKTNVVTLFRGKIQKKIPPPPQTNETKYIAQKVQKILIEKHNFSKKDFC